MNEIITTFEIMRASAELRALSKVSLERPLTDKELNRMIKLKEEIFGE